MFFPVVILDLDLLHFRGLASKNIIRILVFSDYSTFICFNALFKKIYLKSIRYKMNVEKNKIVKTIRTTVY